MRAIERTSRFKRDYRREKSGILSKRLDQLLIEAIDLLAADRPLPQRYFDHPLSLVHRFAQKESARVPAAQSCLAGTLTELSLLLAAMATVAITLGGRYPESGVSAVCSCACLRQRPLPADGSPAGGLGAAPSHWFGRW